MARDRPAGCARPTEPVATVPRLRFAFRAMKPCPSLRRHDPDQVLRVAGQLAAPSQSATADPPRNIAIVEHRGSDGNAGADDLQMGSIAMPCEPIHYLTIEALHGRRRRHGQVAPKRYGANEAVRQREIARPQISLLARAPRLLADRSRRRGIAAVPANAKSRQAAGEGQTCCFCKCLDADPGLQRSGSGAASSPPTPSRTVAAVRMPSMRSCDIRNERGNSISTPISECLLMPTRRNGPLSDKLKSTSRPSRRGLPPGARSNGCCRMPVPQWRSSSNRNAIRPAHHISAVA